MNEERIDVVVVLNEAGETSIPLEIAAAINEDNLRIHVCSFFEPDSKTFNMDIEWLEANSQFDPKAYLRLFQFIRDKDADVVHIHPNGTGSVARVLLALSGTPIVTTEHTTHDHFKRAKLIINGSTNIFSDIIVSNSESTRNSFKKWEQILLRISGTDVEVIYNGVDVEAINAVDTEAELFGITGDFLIGTVGRLTHAKNQAALIQAATPLLKSNDNVRIVLVGDGPLREGLETLATDLGVEDRVHFLGQVSRRKVYTVMAALDIFAFPSHYEGFGVAVAEAMAMGIPVVVNDIPVLHEVIGDAGMYVNAEDTAEFADAIDRLYCDDAHRQDLAKRGAKRIKQRFSLTRTAEEYTSLYRQIINSSIKS